MSEDVSDVIKQIVQARMNEHSHKETHPNDNVDIAGLIQSIGKAYHSDWEKQKLEFARNFLSRTWAGIPLPVLSVCGRGTQEIRYSSYLAYYLDGSKPHGLGTRYLDGVLSLLDRVDIDTYQSVVETEKWLGMASGKDNPVDCRCDIFISCGHQKIFIEQKIKSGESINPNSETTQLVRYDEAIENNPEFQGKEKFCIYLTPTGKNPSKSPNWKPLSYTSLVEVGMDVLHKGGISNIARENLRRFLIDILLGPFEKAENEIQDMVEFAKKATMETNFSNRLRFDQAVDRNRTLVDLLMEG